MACKRTYQWNLKKVPESGRSQDSALFSDFQNSTFRYIPLEAMQSVSIFSVFPSVAVQIFVGTLAGKVAALCMACKSI
jgi:hypothetical protein